MTEAIHPTLHENLLAAAAEAEPSRGERYLGPATVTSVDKQRVGIRLPDGTTASARIAFPFPYDAVVGDELLAIGQAEDFFVLGVLAGKGKTRLAFEGDVELSAQGGRLTLSSDQGVDLVAPRVSLTAQSLVVAARQAVQTFQSLRQVVREAFSLQAGQMHTNVEGTHLAQAQNTKILSEKKVTINGREIYLG